MKNKESYEIRQLDCYLYDNEWTVNTSYLFGTMETSANNIKQALTNWLKRKHGIVFFKGRTIIEYDGDCYTITDRKTLEPLFIAVPN